MERLRSYPDIGREELARFFKLTRKDLGFVDKLGRRGVVTLMEMVATARTGAGALTSEKADHLLTGQMRGDLDRLLVQDVGLGMSRLTWLSTPAVEATAPSVKLGIEKLLFLRGVDAHLLDLSMLPRERRRFLATLGRRSTV